MAKASWSTLDSKLVLTATASIPSGVRVTSIVPWFAGIRLPASGLTGNQIDLTILTRAVAGEVLPTPITQSPSVGLVKTQPAASFGGAYAGSVATITISWALNVPVQP